MDYKVLLFRLDADLMKAFARIIPIRRVSQAVLIAQVFFNLRVNLFDCLLAGNFKQPTAGFARHLFQYFLSIHTRLLRSSAASASRAAATTTHSSYSAKSAAEGMVFIIFE